MSYTIFLMHHQSPNFLCKEFQHLAGILDEEGKQFAGLEKVQGWHKKY